VSSRTVPDAAVARLADRVRAAASAREPLRIRGGDTKVFYGNEVQGTSLDTRDLAGIVAYEPGELVVTARAGTPLADVEAELAAHGQMLPFEPPHFAPGATVGGCVAAGLSGPRRVSAGPAYGAVRDYVLGACVVDGRGRVLAFGGTVIKNVAGFDLSRTLAGSLGVLGVITEVSLKVLPRPARETSLRFECTAADAVARCNAWGGRPLPVSASAWCEGALVVRLSGAAAAVDAARSELGGEPVGDGASGAPSFDGAGFWSALRDQRMPFFAGDAPLWRIALPSTAAPLDLGERELIEWGGALRWLRSDRPAADIRGRARALGGHATLFRGGDRTAGAFTPLAPALAAIHRRLKAEFDPAGILNPGRLFPES
jgi:glycolate oxidase FAD binding subunit